MDNLVVFEKLIDLSYRRNLIGNYLGFSTISEEFLEIQNQLFDDESIDLTNLRIVRDKYVKMLIFSIENHFFIE